MKRYIKTISADKRIELTVHDDGSANIDIMVKNHVTNSIGVKSSKGNDYVRRVFYSETNTMIRSVHEKDRLVGVQNIIW